MTIPHDTTAKLIGLAATGAAMLGMNLSDALLLDPQELSALIRSMHGDGLLPTGTAGATVPQPLAPVAAAIPPAPVYESDEDFLAGFSLR